MESYLIFKVVLYAHEQIGIKNFYNAYSKEGLQLRFLPGTLSSQPKNFKYGIYLKENLVKHCIFNMLIKTNLLCHFTHH